MIRFTLARIPPEILGPTKVWLVVFRFLPNERIPVRAILAMATAALQETVPGIEISPKAYRKVPGLIDFELSEEELEKIAKLLTPERPFHLYPHPRG